jgi:hypothetical protein
METFDRLFHTPRDAYPHGSPEAVELQDFIPKLAKFRAAQPQPRAASDNQRALAAALGRGAERDSQHVPMSRHEDDEIRPDPSPTFHPPFTTQAYCAADVYNHVSASLGARCQHTLIQWMTACKGPWRSVYRPRTTLAIKSTRPSPPPPRHT